MKLFILLTLVFSLSLYWLWSMFLWQEIVEDDFYTPHSHVHTDEALLAEIEEVEELSAAKETGFGRLSRVTPSSRTIFLYKPRDLEWETDQTLKQPILQVVWSESIKGFMRNIVVILHENEGFSRGNMKDKIIRLYEVQRMGQTETLSVFTHELAHYIDMYFFDKKNGTDLSYEFYKISWIKPKIQREWQDLDDFVSGYAASNVYEDFAESMLYYMLHNDDFLLKTAASEKLTRKYEFFAEYVFPDQEFQNTDFSDWVVKNYYRDITKINYSLEKFLEYLKKAV